MKKNPINRLAILLILAMVLYQNKAYAMGNVTVPTASNEIISVDLPVVEERDPFSFFIDPLHIFYNTFGNSGGDITVEEDTYLLFYNRDESEYTLSSRSDSLKIVNKSTVPVQVTITAKLENAGGISVMQDKEFEDRNSCDLYLALVDNEGNEQPLLEDGEVSVTVKLDRAPLDAYAYVLCEDTGEYQYAFQSGDVAFDVYSFGLMGACNEKGDWTSISGKPHVTISWNVEPVVSEGSGAGEESDEKLREISGNTVSGNDVLDMDEQSTSDSAADSEEISNENAAVDTGNSVSGNDVLEDKGTTVSGNDVLEDKGVTEDSECAQQGCSVLMVEIQPDNVLTTPSVANLVPAWVTVQVKHRKSGIWWLSFCSKRGAVYWDGACSADRIIKFAPKGMDGLMLGTTLLLGKDRPYEEIIREIREM